MENVKLDVLRALVEERDQVRNEFNNQIAKLLTPSVLTAMFELFGLEPEAVEWSALDVIEELLIVVVNVTYKMSDSTSMFLKHMDQVANAGPNALVRTLKVGIPLKLAFAPVEEIKTFLLAAAARALAPSTPSPVVERTANDFEISELTKEQLQQLTIYQQMSKIGKLL